MTRLTTRHQRQERVIDVGLAAACIAVLIGCGWAVAQDGWIALAAFAGALVVYVLIVWGSSLVKCWIDTGRWFR